MDVHTYKIYNASAGAGKTYILVKSFVSVLLRNKYPKIGNILAITFTNKAANEMKNRILSWLHELSKDEYNDSQKVKYLSLELKIDTETLHERAKNILSYILHHYSLFNVGTIDKFNLRLMKSFAKELGLSYSFAVELDATKYLKESIDELIDQLGSENPFSNVILNYIFWNFESDNHLDIREKLLFSSKNFIEESNLENIYKISEKDFDEFKKLNSLLIDRINKNKDLIRNIAQETVKIIEENSIELTDFPGGKNGGAGSFFIKLLDSDNEKNDFKGIDFNAKNLSKFFVDKNLISAKSKKIEQMEFIYDDLKINFYKLQELVNRLKVDKSVKKNLITIEMQSEISRFLSNKKEENDVLLLSDVNPIISNHIKNEAIPFIYEKLGGRYDHYFIDEFQDTSRLQWNNLISLIDDTKATENKSITLVGDPKQAIYRFRSGDPKIMLDLMETAENERIDVITLPYNYRSLPNIVDFNNQYYQFISESIENKDYKYLFGEKAIQKAFIKVGGRVQISFVKNPDEECNYLAERALNLVKECIENGFSLKDIVVLVRKKSQAYPITEILMKGGYKILTEESLLISSSSAIQTIINILKWLNYPDNKEYLFYMLYYFDSEKIINIEDFSEKLFELKDLKFQKIIEKLKELELEIPLNTLEYLSFFDYCEDLIRSLNFKTNSDMYIVALMDIILKLEKNGAINIKEFLDYWELKKDTASIVFPADIDAIQVMSIHKSKGLEFPVVIYPVINSIRRSSSYWFPIEEKEYNGFNQYYVQSGGKEVEGINAEIDEILDQVDFEKDIDELCVQYVATTRASQQLFIIQQLKDLSKQSLNIFQKFIDTNLANGEKNQNKNKKEESISLDSIIEIYPDSNKVKIFENEGKSDINQKNIEWISESWKEKIKVSLEGKAFYSEKNPKIAYGNIVHNILSEIYSKKDVSKAVSKAIMKGVIPVENRKNIENILFKVIDLKGIKIFFDDKNSILNEADIIYEGQLLRPDRVVLKDKECYLLDFKTGIKLTEHIQQLRYYSSILKSLGYEIKQALILYIHDEMEIVDIFSKNSSNVQLDLFSDN